MKKFNKYRLIIIPLVIFYIVFIFLSPFYHLHLDLDKHHHHDEVVYHSHIFEIQNFSDNESITSLHDLDDHLNVSQNIDHIYTSAANLNSIFAKVITINHSTETVIQNIPKKQVIKRIKFDYSICYRDNYVHSAANTSPPSV